MANPSVIEGASLGFQDPSGNFIPVSAAHPLPVTAAGAGSGDMVGPGSATDGRVATFDGTSGKLIKNSAAPNIASATGESLSVTTGTTIELGRGSILVQGETNRERMEILGPNGGFFQAYLIGGTIASPTATPAGPVIVGMTARGHDGTGYVVGSKGSAEFYSTETWAPGANGTGFRIRTTPTGSTTLGTVVDVTSAGAAVTGNLSMSGAGTFGTDVESTTVGSGFILKSPDGTRYRIAVSNIGVLSAAAA